MEQKIPKLDNQIFGILVVEPEGFEPSSKLGKHTSSTCLVLF